MFTYFKYSRYTAVDPCDRAALVDVEGEGGVPYDMRVGCRVEDDAVLSVEGRG